MHADVLAFEERRSAAERIIVAVAKQAVLGAIVCAIFAAGAAILSEKVMLGLEAFVACGVALAGSFGLGAIGAALSPPAHRSGWMIAWLRTHLWLHVAWLTAPLSGTLVLVAMWAHHQGNGYSGGWLTTLLVMGPLFWLLFVIAGAVRWWVRFGAQIGRMQLRGVRARVALCGAAGIILLGAMVLGLSAGAVSAEAADKITPISAFH